MEEFWVCQNCKSLNRAGSSKCYSCRTKFGASPPAAAAPTNARPLAPLARGPIPDFGAVPAQASQYARPTSFTPAAAAAGQVAYAPGRSFAHPIAAVKSRVASSLSTRQSVSVTALGFVTAVLLGLILALGAPLLLAVMPAAGHLLQHADAAAAWAQLSPGRQGLVESLSVALLIVGTLAGLCLSLFVGLTTHNATGLGADRPLLSPYRAGTCWARVPWTQARVAVGLIVPAVLVWRDYVIPGLLAGIVAVEIAHRRLDDQSSWLSRPARHLPDLYIKLGVEGSVSSRLASLWSACFRMANGLAIVVCAVPAIALSTHTVATLAGHPDLVTWQSNGLGAWQGATALLVANLIGWTAASIVLLVAITVGLVNRQRVRRTLVRVGRARSWVARPGEGGYAPGARSQPATHDDFDENRLVERLPRFPTSPGPGPEDGGPGFGGPARSQDPGSASYGSSPFGGPRTGSGTPDQASLNSPSTTSSFPWSDEPPADPD